MVLTGAWGGVVDAGGQATWGGAMTAVNILWNSVSRRLPAGRCRVWMRAEYPMRAGMLISAVRMVAVRALPSAVPVRAAAARVRL